jgi:type I restriction enzyme, S subunit
MLNKLPPNWNLKKVDDVANIYLGLTYTPTYTESGVPFLSVKDLNDTYLDFENSKFISLEEYKNATENAKPKKGDIIFGRVGTLGNPLIIETDIEFCIFVSLGFFRIRNNSCEPNFLASWMKSPLFHTQVDKIVAGGAQKNLNTGWLKNFVIPLPPLPEQKAIAKVLSTADAAIHATEKLIAQKEIRKKWLMQQLLTGKKRLKGFEGEWMEYPFEKLLKVVKRPVKWDDNELYKLISVRRRSGGIFFREALYGHQIKVKDLRDATVGDFLFSKMQIVHGASALVTKEFEGAKISGSYLATVAKEPKLLNMEYFNWYSQLPYFYHQALISSYGVHIEKMTFDFETFLQLEMTLPSFEEQTAIAQVLQAADKEISLLKAKEEKLREQKKGLMQVLLTGKVRLLT